MPTEGYKEYLDIICNFGKGFKHLDNFRRNMLMAYVWRARPIQTDVAKYLLEQGNDAAHTDSDGCTCLHHAAYNPQVTLDNFQLLMSNGADIRKINSTGANVLMIYLQHKKPLGRPMIEFMLGHDLRTGQTDTEGCSLLHYAAMNNTCTCDILKLLITSGADINL